MSSNDFDTKNSTMNLTDNSYLYNDLVDYCSLLKEFKRRIPSYYLSKSISYPKKQFNNTDIKKLSKEIMLMQESIEELKSSKQKKLDQIEELRSLMRKVGNKTATSKEKNYIKNNFNNNYCTREKRDNKLSERKGGEFDSLKLSSGDSSTITGADISSGKDDDAGCVEEGNKNGKEGYPWKSSNLESLNLSQQNSLSTNPEETPIINPIIINNNSFMLNKGH